MTGSETEISDEAWYSASSCYLITFKYSLDYLYIWYQSSTRYLHNWILKPELQPGAGQTPDHVAVDGTVIRLNEYQYKREGIYSGLSVLSTALFRFTSNFELAGRLPTVPPSKAAEVPVIRRFVPTTHLQSAMDNIDPATQRVENHSIEPNCTKGPPGHEWPTIL